MTKSKDNKHTLESMEALRRKRKTARSEKKSVREKKKRDIMNQQFDEISAMLNINQTSVDRTTILERLLVEVLKKNKQLEEQPTAKGYHQGIF
mmetsp:Transcript_8700/g.13770  ORF Transcript_8700/g.13770 Transcript_8700/m.13770 type:complete len:93 (-) Transcript_8700:1241-1519(-)